MANYWTRNEEIIVFNLYCKIPFQKSNKSHPDVIRIANLIGRTPSAVNMKIGNFGSFDENLKSKGIVGLTNASKLDGEIFHEFMGNWDELAYQSEMLTREFSENAITENEIDIPKGAEKIVTTKQRINQSFFRSAVLASYNCACCITGISNRELLIASHIKPWKASNENEKTNPKNGLCLNALFDRAFDRGFLTIKPNYSIIISDSISDICDGNTVDIFFKRYKNTRIHLPEKFLPSKEFLEYHNDTIYECWK